MKTVSTIALALVLAAGSTGAFAQSAYDSISGSTSSAAPMQLQPLEAIDQASSFNIVQVSPTDANSLRFDNDVGSLQSRISQNNKALEAVSQAGYSIDQVVGVQNSDVNSVTLFVVG